MASKQPLICCWVSRHTDFLKIMAQDTLSHSLNIDDRPRWPRETKMTSDPKWSPCAPGTLSGICEQNCRGTGNWTRRSATAAIVAAIAGGSWLVAKNRPGTGVSCAQVSKLAPQYVAGTLTPHLVLDIEIHRSHCHACDVKLEQLESRSATS